MEQYDSESRNKVLIVSDIIKRWKILILLIIRITLFIISCNERNEKINEKSINFFNFSLEQR